MRTTPSFDTPDANFAYLVQKLHHGSWDTNPVRHDFNTFVWRYPSFDPRPRQPLAKFLRAKAAALRTAGDETAIERLRAHVRRAFSRELKWKRPEWGALVDELAGPRTAPSTAYVFKREGAYSEQKLAKLPANDQRQFLVAAGRYLGGKFRAVPACCKKLRSDSDGGGVDIQRWRISVKGKPRAARYEMWTFMVDNGTVFPIGEMTPVVEMIQGAFQITKANADLAADLQAVVPF